MCMCCDVYASARAQELQQTCEGAIVNVDGIDQAGESLAACLAVADGVNVC